MQKETERKIRTITDQVTKLVILGWLIVLTINVENVQDTQVEIVALVKTIAEDKPIFPEPDNFVHVLHN